MSDVLQLKIKRPLRPVPEGDWNWRSEAAAIGYSINMSGLQDKAIAIECEIDPSTLAKAKQGTARLAEENLERLLDATGSEAWLFYWLIKRGYDPRSLRRFESDVERENRELKDLLASKEREREIELRLIREMRMAA